MLVQKNTRNEYEASGFVEELEFLAKRWADPQSVGAYQTHSVEDGLSDMDWYLVDTKKRLAEALSQGDAIKLAKLNGAIDDFGVISENTCGS